MRFVWSFCIFTCGCPLFPYRSSVGNVQAAEVVLVVLDLISALVTPTPANVCTAVRIVGDFGVDLFHDDEGTLGAHSQTTAANVHIQVPRP